MRSRCRTTRDHDEIREWVTSHDGVPARVRDIPSVGRSGMLRIDFAQRNGHVDLEHISWDEWFRSFEHAELALVYEAEKSGACTFAKVVPAPDF
ncbi:hypothetical protein [Gordonia sp. 'Campus']|uniref:hypothetical protein n=1 Tax=Gordonia sp. 'Campus' TaxID=2915824 RepID=UPI001EE3F344|nr:hypothetical protein [Gordonia sp. 'Campus']